MSLEFFLNIFIDTVSMAAKLNTRERRERGTREMLIVPVIVVVDEIKELSKVREE